MFHFLCFVLNKRHQNRCILAHYGARFDNVVVVEFLLRMGIKPEVLPLGEGVLQVFVPEYSLTFLDSFRYFSQKLASLPSRFGLEKEVVKGFFPHKYNRPENWNKIQDQPPPLEDYILENDSKKDRDEKTHWYETVKSKESIFDLNKDCVVYAKMDVRILMASCCKFLKQTFEFNQQMIDRFGTSPSFRPSLQPYFHPFSKTIPTLGAFS